MSVLDPLSLYSSPLDLFEHSDILGGERVPVHIPQHRFHQHFVGCFLHFLVACLGIASYDSLTCDPCEFFCVPSILWFLSLVC